MSNRFLFILLAVVIVAIGTLFVVNYGGKLGVTVGQKYLPYETLRGMAVEHDNLLFTLNYNQQNSVADYINQSQELQSGLMPRKRALDVQRILVYRFNQPSPLEILPLDYDQDDNLLFSAPALYNKGVLKDTSQGKLKELLSKTYDP